MALASFISFICNFDLTELMNCQVDKCSNKGTEKITGLHDLNCGLVIKIENVFCKNHAEIVSK